MSAAVDTNRFVTADEIIAAGRVLQGAQRVAVVCSENIDGDSYGVSKAMYHAMKNLGKHTRLFHRLPMHRLYRFDSDWSLFEKDFDPSEWDAVIIPDTSEPWQTGYDKQYPALFDPKDTTHPPVINIDHHHSNTYFGAVNIVKPKSESTASMAYTLLKGWGVKMTPEIADGLLMGIYYDTAGFMHGHSPEVLRTTAALVRAGGNAHRMAHKLLRERDTGTLRLWGRALERLEVDSNGMAHTYLLPGDFAATGTNREHTAEIANFLSSVPASYAMFVYDDGSKVKGSLRTQRDDLDMTAIAGRFGGGGHKKASGFTINGSSLLPERKYQLVQVG